jgi:hypothetical protein
LRGKLAVTFTVAQIEPNAAIRAELVRLGMGLDTAAKLFEPSGEDASRMSILLILSVFDDLAPL